MVNDGDRGGVGGLLEAPSEARAGIRGVADSARQSEHVDRYATEWNEFRLMFFKTD